MTAAYVFDAYGTLLDVHAAVHRHAAQVGPDFQRFSDLWRAKQLEYSWVRSLMGGYAPFWRLTEEALDYAFAKFPEVDRSLKPALLEAYLGLDTYPDVLPALEALKARGLRLAILSNGSPDMLGAGVTSAGLAPLLDAVFSVDEVGCFKTDPRAYAMVAERWSLDPGKIVFVSSNRWDIAGATRAGFQTCWLNRTDQPDEYRDLPPVRVIRTLRDL